ncbi:hypothetical protein ACFQ0K_05595 [Nocardioides caeni]|uniref:Thioesterase family protein n=1 Tax=Nocardioides caeni TaxID=574700 RepID=A0A4S8N8W2_9ACTN|nr:hypothetical protein [Nocardioides caeni]THV12161.1 hypothetical protein E9934_12505 [Nocardioides caeni]
MSTLRIPRRFNGPPSSGNGGWVAGALAATHPAATTGPVTVTLRRPPPLETPLTLSQDGDRLEARHGDLLVAEASSAVAAPAPVAGVDPARAEEAMASYPGLGTHPFPTCFVCGPGRAQGDGLRIFPGRVAEHAVAAVWTPDEDAARDPATTWAALDCPGGWASDIEDRPAVLGRMTAVVHRQPEAGVPHVVVGELRRVDGRKSFTAATLHAVADGRCDEVVATAEHVWIAIDPEEFR